MSNTGTRILSSAMTLFQEQGYMRTTLGEIARVSKSAESSIYRTFSCKEHIFSKLVELESKRLLNRIKHQGRRYKGDLNPVEVYIEKRISLLSEVSQRYEFLKLEYMEMLPVIERSREASLNKELAYVESLFLECHLKGYLVAKRPEVSAYVLVHTLKSLEIPMFVTQSVPTGGRLLQDLKSMVLYGAGERIQTGMGVSTPETEENQVYI